MERFNKTSPSVKSRRARQRVSRSSDPREIDDDSRKARNRIRTRESARISSEFARCIMNARNQHKYSIARYRSLSPRPCLFPPVIRGRKGRAGVRCRGINPPSKITTLAPVERISFGRIELKMIIDRGAPDRIFERYRRTRVIRRKGWSASPMTAAIPRRSESSFDNLRSGLRRKSRRTVCRLARTNRRRRFPRAIFRSNAVCRIGRRFSRQNNFRCAGASPRRITVTLSKGNGALRISGFIVNLLRVHTRRAPSTCCRRIFGIVRVAKAIGLPMLLRE